jgi:hypothetical protein
MVTHAYLEAAAAAVDLLHDPAVAAAWDGPSALQGFAVSGLAGHLARQVFQVPRLLALDPPDAQPIALLEHYARSAWVKADVDDEVNVRIRRDGQAEATEGPATLAAHVKAAAEDLRDTLPAQPTDRVVYLSWGPWALSLGDFLTTRMLEIAIHNDDLAVSVGVDAPELSPAVIEPVVDILSRMAVRRHGAVAVLRALSRAERAPVTIAAI